MSKKLLSFIKEYVLSNKTLFFIEAMFPTIAYKHGLKHDNPIEFQKLAWRYDWSPINIAKTEFVHPVKKMENHILFREIISKH